MLQRCPPIVSFLVLTAAAPATAQDCEATADDILAAHSDTLTAFTEMDAEALIRIRGQAHANVDCLVEVLPPTAAGALHRVEAIASFLARDLERTELALLSARLSDPEYGFPIDIVPAGHPLDRIVQKAAERTETERAAILHPPGTVVLVDGIPSELRPFGRPVVVQLVKDGEPRWSSYIEPGESLPRWEAQPEPVAVVAPDPEPIAVDKRKPTVELAVAAGGLAMLSGAFYGTAAGSHARFQNPETPFEDIGGLQKQTNSLMSASVVTAGAALGLGVTSALTTVRF
jgi:hypothetical protein